MRKCLSLILFLAAVCPVAAQDRIARTYKKGDAYRYKLTCTSWQNKNWTSTTVSICLLTVVYDSLGTPYDEVRWESSVSTTQKDTVTHAVDRVQPYRISLAPGGSIPLPPLTVPDMTEPITDFNTFFVAISPQAGVNHLSRVGDSFAMPSPVIGRFGNGVNILKGEDCIQTTLYLSGSDKDKNSVLATFMPPAKPGLTYFTSDMNTPVVKDTPNNFQMVMPAGGGKFHLQYGREYFVIQSVIRKTDGKLLGGDMYNALTLSLHVNCDSAYQHCQATLPMAIERKLTVELLQAPQACPVFTPMMYLSQAPIYSDARSSIPDTAAERKNREEMADLGHFLTSIEKALDGQSDTAAITCAWSAFQSWADAGALTQQPQHYNLQGTVAVGENLIGINMLALKFKAQGYTLPGGVLRWLHTLNDQNMDYYQRATNRGNLYVWSGAAAALMALIDRYPKALQYQDLVWRDAMSKIKDDGTIDGEMVREQRALIYHLFSFSATLILRSAREALGYAPEDTRVRLLADMIGKTLCDPGTMAITAKATQETPGDWAYRVPIGFGQGLLSQDWTRCGIAAKNLVDPGTGGDTRRSAATLQAIHTPSGSSH
ncbi:alginate lyase family protein [Dinghuibacter silviterrae]|uniref:Alginate lyase n=1 Tax=Dinghuibacter silviterrae TaxID=1539049 RepID=A0A4R8DRA7_9BACT|nr:alginate lyase family protein [Dinghuibacter silviterrae]TDX00338.1 alginate lyase [Dinghuibacter silviterrae]